MMKVCVSGFVGLVLISGCADPHQHPGYLPKKIRVLKKGGISVRDGIAKGSARVDAVHENYEYDVFDALPAYYKTEVPEEIVGWIAANTADGWTESVGSNKVKITHPEGLAVRMEPYNIKSDQIGSAHSSYTYPVLKVEYSHFKISIPNGTSGWIYGGKPEDRWAIIIE